MATVTFKEEHEGNGLVATVDLIQPLQFDSGGNASIDLPGGVHHLFWSAFGPPTAKVTMSITSPSESAFSQTDLVGPQMKNAWAHEFHVGTDAGATPPVVHAAIVPFVVPKSKTTKVVKGKKL